MLLYIFWVKPFKSTARNSIEIANEGFIYGLSFLMLSFMAGQGVMEPADFAKAGRGLIGLIVTMAFVNMGLIAWGICETLYEAMASRESTMIGRLLRYWFKVKLADPPECTCECCTCADDRRQGYFSP